MPLLPLEKGAVVRAWWPATTGFYKATVVAQLHTDAGFKYRLAFADGETMRDQVPRSEIASAGHCAHCDKDMPWVLCAIAPRAICLACRNRINYNIRRRVGYKKQHTSTTTTATTTTSGNSTIKRKRGGADSDQENESYASNTRHYRPEPPAKRTRSRAVATAEVVEEGVVIMSDESSTDHASASTSRHHNNGSSVAEPSAPTPRAADTDDMDVPFVHGRPGATLPMDIPALALPPLVSAAHKRTALFAEALATAINQATAFPVELDASVAALADPTVPGPLADWLRTAGYVACRGPRAGSIWIAFRLS